MADRLPVHRFGRLCARLRAALIAPFVVVALAAGCGLPVSGTVEEGLPVERPDAPPIKVEFEAPRQGASPDEIVRGFLAAQWSADDNYRQARAYLTRGAAQDWKPQQVVVYPTGMPPRTRASGDGSTVTVSVVEIGTLDPEGHFRASPVNSTSDAAMGLSKVAGEWRIDSLPDDFGLWLSKFYFDNAYRSYQVAFVSAEGNRVVPHWRRFEVGAGLSTALARAMLNPVPAYLDDAVVTAFPRDAELNLPAVPVTGGTAQVELTSAVTNLDTRGRQAAWAQALRTMRQIPDTESVTLMSEGAPLGVPGVEGLPRRLSDVGYEGAPPRSSVVLRRVGSVLTPLSSTSFPTEVRSGVLPPLPSVPAQWPAAAISLDLRDVVAVHQDRDEVARWVNGQEVQITAPGTSLTLPSFDALGRPWMAGMDEAGRAGLWTYPPVDSQGNAGGEAQRIELPWSTERTVLDVRPSPEGMRAVVLSKDRAGAVHIEIAGVVRDGAGTPTRLDQPLPVSQDIAEATSVMWIDERTLGVVGTRISGEPHTALVSDLNDVSEERDGISGVQRLISLGNTSGLAAVNGANQLLRRSGTRWLQVGVASDLLVPGR